MNATQIDRISAKILSEQINFDTYKPRNVFDPTTGKMQAKTDKKTGHAAESLSKFWAEHKHDIMFAASIAVLLVPIPGVNVALSAALSAGIAGADAAMYWAEGDRHSAMTMAASMLMPGMGKLIQKIPGIKQLGAKGMRSLFRKLIQSKQGAKVVFSKIEQGIIKLLPQNKKLIQSEFAQKAGKIVNKVAKSKAAKKAGNRVLKAPIGAAKAAASFKAADIVQQKVVNPIYVSAGFAEKDLEDGNASDLDALVALNKTMK
jgi:hypothetical protein